MNCRGRQNICQLSNYLKFSFPQEALVPFPRRAAFRVIIPELSLQDLLPVFFWGEEKVPVNCYQVVLGIFVLCLSAQFTTAVLQGSFCLF